MEFTDLERDTILAALRLWQEYPRLDRTDELEDIASNGGEHGLMTVDQIDDLCEKINQ